jgi:3-oxoadipate enol-lactonase / 4-carboxymuconolactone decarboxylase
VSARLAHRFDGPEDAPVVVLASSLGTTAAIWDAQVPILAKRYRVLRYDHRGHGASAIPPGPYTIDELGRDVLALLDEHGIDRFSFSGLSLGGMVGIWLAATAPQRIERLALLCTSARLGTPEGWDERITALQRSGIEGIADAVVARWFSDDFAARKPEEVAHWRAVLTNTPLEGYVACCAAIRDFDLRGRLTTIAAPTLVVAGLQDMATPVEHQATLAARIPGARLVVLDGAAHLATVEQAPAVASALLDHLEAGVDRHQRGTAVRRAVLGDAHVDAAIAATTSFNEDFQRYLTGAAWADVWDRDGIDRRMRSAITLTALLAVNRMEEFALHVRAAHRNGLGSDEIGEIVLNAAVYLGVPAANDGFRVAARVMAEEP